MKMNGSVANCPVFVLQDWVMITEKQSTWYEADKVQCTESQLSPQCLLEQRQTELRKARVSMVSVTLYYGKPSLEQSVIRVLRQFIPYADLSADYGCTVKDSC